MSLFVDIEKNFKGFHLKSQFEAGDETMGLLGASGCGKSLTMRSIAGIEKPDCGKIVVNDVVFFDKAQNKKAKVDLTPQQRKTALLFQNYMLFPNLTVEQNVAAGITKETSQADRDNLVNQELKRFNLEGLEKRYPVQLSGGQQQRVALARMLAARPQILMLDEPFSALDSYLKDQLGQDLAKLFESFDGTVLYISHDIDEALSLCNRIAVIDNGQIKEIDDRRELLNNPKCVAALKLTGCKNILSASRNDDKIEVSDLGIELSATSDLKDVNFVGIRSFDIEETKESTGENVFKATVSHVTRTHWEQHILLQLEGAKTTLFWKKSTVGRDWDDINKVGEELYIKIPKEKVVLTKD